MIKKALFFFTIFSLFFASSLFAAQDAIPDYQYRQASINNIKTFYVVVTKEKAVQMQLLESKYKDRTKKIKKHPTVHAFDKILNATKLLIDDVEKNGLNRSNKRKFMRLQRLHYGLKTDIGGAKQAHKVKSAFSFLKNIAFGPLVMKVPESFGPDQPIGQRQAKKESENLYHPGKKVPVTLAELAKMTPIEISRLDISPDHAGCTGQEPGSHFEKYTQVMKKLIRQVSKKLKKFDFKYAKRILFFHEIKNSATSPKIATKDRFGLKWKLKWGDEVHTDVALTRLYINLGGTYTDFKFYSGPGETILILDHPNDQSPEAIRTFDELATALLNSKYKFHAHRYLLPKPVLKDKKGQILGTGIVDEAMIERESLKENKLGCYYVKFKECQLSLYNPVIKRLGGAALSNAGATKDRVARSSIVFNAWIKNKDMKDDNSRVGLIYNPATEKFDKYVEFQSDLGCTMGGLIPSGALNLFESSFVQYQVNSINFKMRPLYIPKSWKSCSWSDARWMALRIGRLTRENIEECFAESGWPSFIQKLAVEKLISRRNELIKAFKLDLDGIKPIKCNPKFSVNIKGDYPIKRGKINKNSRIIKKLRRDYHPEGLADIIPRSKD